MKDLPPWKRPRPPGTRSKLSPQQLAAARERAQQAGRRYPNLVDNLWAAKLKPQDLTRPLRDPDRAGPDA